MELVVNFKEQYAAFIRRYKSNGICMGLCLVWLGDILKNRPDPAQAGFAARWTPSWLSAPSSIAHIPFDQVALEALFQRALKRQKSYLLKSENHDPYHPQARTAILVNKKNQRQLFLEEKSGNPGLKYTYREFDNLFATQGLDFTGRAQGTIITMWFPKRNTAHAIAVISLSPRETYFLDPNLGLFKVDSANIALEIAENVLATYENPRIADQIIISRK